ncbi:MAG: hypothetical protein R3F23_03320 [Verrucomicrobiia bacterium]
MIPLSTTLGGQAAISLRDMLMGVPFLLCVFGIIERTWNSENKPKELFNSIIVTAIVVGLITSFPIILNELRDGFISIHKKFEEIPLLEKLYTTKIAEGDSPSKWDIGNYICYVGVLLMQKLGYFSVRALVWFQEFAINGLTAVSPILLGFLATSYTKSIGINFLLTSLGVVLWHLGFAIVDVVLFNLSGPILAVSGLSAFAAGSALISGTIGWPLALAGLLLIVIISNTMYLSVPFVVQALLRGANPATTALAAGIQGTTTAIGMGVGAKFALGQLANSSASSFIGAKDASEAGSSLTQKGLKDSPNHAQHNPVNDSMGSYSSNASVPPPPSIKPFTAKAGDSVSHGDFTATQTNPEHFTLSHQKTGALSQHAGNIGAPQDLMAGINMHEVKAKQQSFASSSPSLSQQRQELDQKLNS